jgi:hypothetical protein
MRIKKHSVVVLLSIIVQLAAACSLSASNMEGEKWVIFSDRQARDLGIAEWFIQPGQTAEYWTPSEEAVLAIEGELVAFLQENSDRFYSQGIPVWERLDDYNRQYLGIILDGKRLVYANCFCDSTGRDWKKDFVMVLDGGDCFFQFKYDVDSGEFFDLQVNGNA